jgi:tRNA modification GTPase
VADLILHCVPCDGEPRWAAEETDHANKLLVVTKCDQLPTSTASRWPNGALVTSAVEGVGLAELRTRIAARLRQKVHEGPTPLGTAARCRGSVLAAEAAIRSAIEALELTLGEELVAADLRLAIDELGRVIGSVVTDDILDRIFSRFCIGK